MSWVEPMLMVKIPQGDGRHRDSLDAVVSAGQTHTT